MKHFFSIVLLLLCTAEVMAQSQICNPNGNLIIYSNYDGGVLNIDIDQNIPNLKIGVVSYEAVSINISGPFVSNVTAVTFAGFPSTGGSSCGPGSPSGSSSISGVSSSIVNIANAPPAGLANTNGNNSVICAYSCNVSSYQGGCNTVDQVVAYFQNQFQGSILRYHFVQYNCWLQSETRSMSQGGNCCLLPPAAPVVDFTASADTICPGECLDFTDNSLNNPTSWSWVFQGGTPDTSSSQNPQDICFLNPGSYTINLTASNATGSGALNKSIVVKPKPTFTAQPLSVTTNPGNSHQFSTTLSGSNNQLQWQMNDGSGFNNLSNGGQFSGVTSNILTVSNITLNNNANQYRCIAVLNGCSDTSEIAIMTVVDNTGEAELLMAGISISPNPASQVLNIQCRGRSNLFFQIRDLQGKLVLNDKLQAGLNMITLDQISPGIYLFNIPEIGGACMKLIVE